MRRGMIILLLGLAGAALAYCCVYLAGTATPRALMQSAQPELAWLKHEFNLSDPEFARIARLHAGYLPRCEERCRRIEQLNGTLSRAIATAPEVTPEIQNLLGERAQVRALCQAEMLKHFLEVSRSMPPEQGRRYLAWVRENTCLREQAMHGDAGSHSAAPGPMRQP
jgi:hypothetical protein